MIPVDQTTLLLEGVTPWPPRLSARLRRAESGGDDQAAVQGPLAASGLCGVQAAGVRPLSRPERAPCTQVRGNVDRGVLWRHEGAAHGLQE